MATLSPRPSLPALSVTLASLLVWVGCGGEAPDPVPSVPPQASAVSPIALDASTLLAAAQSAADSLVRHQGEDGEGIERRENDLQQASACLALLNVFRQTGEARYLTAAETGLDLLLKQTRGPRAEAPSTEGTPGFLAVVLDDSFSDPADPDDVGSAGASALALLALLEHQAATDSPRWSEATDGLARFLAFQQQPDGEILPRYFYGESRGGPFKPPFGTSTAALALLRYSRTQPDGVLSSWFNRGQRAAGWLMAVRDLGKTYDELSHDARLLQALDELHELSGGGRTYYLHARRVAQGILETREEDAAGTSPSKPCSPRTLERAMGMVSVVRIARREKVSTQVYEEALEEMLRELLGCQRADAASLFIAAHGVLALATLEAPG